MSWDWDTEVRPVLDAVYRAIRNHPKPEFGVSQEDVNDELGREATDMATAFALDNLVSAGFLTERMKRIDQQTGPGTVELTEKALRIVAGWPSTPTDALYASLVAEINAQIEIADAEEKSKLERFRDFAVGAGRDVIVAVLTQQAQKINP